MNLPQPFEFDNMMNNPRTTEYKGIFKALQKSSPPIKIKRICSRLSFFYLSLYLPVVVMAYFPFWYLYNFRFHNRYRFIGIEYAKKCVDELSSFLRHGGDSLSGWTPKEILHLYEVRDLLDILLIIVIISILIFVMTFDRSRIARYARINIFVFLSLCGLLLFFSFFWVHIFHPLFFSNNAWKITPADKLFYITPRVFFRNSAILLLGVSIFLNSLVWLIFRKRSQSFGFKNRGK